MVIMILTLYLTTLTLMTMINKLDIHDNNNINIMLIHSRSLTKDVDNIAAFLNTLSTAPNFLAITETWLININNKHIHQLPGYHSYHLVSTNRAQGGVTIFISNDLQSEQLPDLTIVINDNIEINTVKVSSSSLSVILCAVYRPHSKYEFVQEFANTLCAPLHKNSECIKQKCHS